MFVSVVAPSRCVRCRRRPRDPRCTCLVVHVPPPAPPIPGVARVVAASVYDGDARRFVLDLKLRGRRDAAGPLVDLLVGSIHRDGVSGDLLTWVPGTPSGVSARGFDHAELLARGVSRTCGLEAKRLLRRDSDLDQTGLSRSERFENLSGAITSKPCRGRKVVLIDDVITTGATARACAAALRAAGAYSVEIVAVARA
jgi:ComF family protein